MSTHLKNILTLSLIGLLAAGFVQFWELQPEYFLNDMTDQQFSDQSQAPKADSYMLSVETKKFAKTGMLELDLVAEESFYFKKNDYFEVVMPKLTAFSAKEGENPWLVSAEKGFIEGGSKKVVLQRNVEMQQQITEQSFNHFSTEQLTFWPEQKQVASDDWVTITTLGSKTSGKGMEADLKEKTFVLKSNVKGVHFGL